MPTFKNKTKEKKIKAWCLVENDKLAHYYTLYQTFFSKRNALANLRYYNKKPLNHKFEIRQCEITINNKQ